MPRQAVGPGARAGSNPALPNHAALADGGLAACRRGHSGFKARLPHQTLTIHLDGVSGMAGDKRTVCAVGDGDEKAASTVNSEAGPKKCAQWQSGREQRLTPGQTGHARQSPRG